MSDQIKHTETIEATVSETPKKSGGRGKKKQTAPEALSYEEAVARLEAIVQRLEGGQEPIVLDESLKLYEEGVALVRRCYQELNEAEQRVKILRRSADGSISPVDFEAAEDSVR